METENMINNDANNEEYPQLLFETCFSRVSFKKI